MPFCFRWWWSGSLSTWRAWPSLWSKLALRSLRPCSDLMVAENDGKHHETPHQQIRDCLHHTCVVLECITVTAHYLQHKDVMCLDAVSKFTIAFSPFLQLEHQTWPHGSHHRQGVAFNPNVPIGEVVGPVPWYPLVAMGTVGMGASRHWSKRIQGLDRDFEAPRLAVDWMKTCLTLEHPKMLGSCLA